MEVITISYWLAVIPTAVTGLTLLAVMKKARDEKTRQEKALVPATARKRRQESVERRN